MVKGSLPCAWRTLAVVLMYWGSATSAAVPSIATQPTDLESFILSNRRAITSGHVMVKVITEDLARSSRTADEMTTRFDWPRVREDLKQRDVIMIRCMGSDAYYQFSVGLSSDAVLRIKDTNRVDPRSDAVHNPLMLMMQPFWYGVGRQLNLESFIGAANRTELRMEKAAWEGEDAWRVFFVKEEATFNYLVVPSRSHNVVAMMRHFEEKDGTIFEQSVQCSLQQVSGDLWFPKTVKFRGSKDGQVNLTQDLEVTVLSINGPIPPEVFTPVSMNVPANTMVSRVPGDRRGALKWDGQKIVPMSKDELFGKFVAQGEQTDPRPRRFVFLSISLVLALIGGFVLWRYYRRRPADGL